jgi:membrane-associated phospholipid phosphatase
MRSNTLMWSGWGTLAAALLLGAAIVSGYAEPPGLDRWWADVVDAHVTGWMLSAAVVLDHVGGGWVGVLVIPVLVVVSLVLAGRWRGAVLAAATFVASAGVVQLLKQVYARARPDDMLVASDFGSFPSGHTANAATIAVVLYLLFPRVWVAVAGIAWTVAMALSRTLLSVHWASDTLGGALVGTSVALLLAAWALPWARTASPRITAARPG